MTAANAELVVCKEPSVTLMQTDERAVEKGVLPSSLGGFERGSAASHFAGKR